MKSVIARRILTVALCAFFTVGLYYAGNLSCVFGDDRRDSWQKPEEIIKTIGLKPGQTIVDIGAGDGYFMRRFARAVSPAGKAIGLEIKADLVEKMNEDARNAGLANYEARLVATDDPKLAPGSIDVIFLCDTYHHIDSRVDYFRKVRHALKPGGRLVILDMVRSKKNTDHSVIREDVIEELRQAGYRLRKEYDMLMPRQYFFEFEPVKDSKEGESAILIRDEQFINLEIQK
jgi:cyclopropane fatty-acyl-phospholipid synthase-like methyltransferase